MLYIHPGRVHRLRRVRARVPGNGDLPREDVPPQWKDYIAKNRDVFQGENPPGKPQRKGS